MKSLKVYLEHAGSRTDHPVALTTYVCVSEDEIVQRSEGITWINGPNAA